MKLALPAVLIAALLVPATSASASILAGQTGTPLASQFSLQGAKLAAFGAGIPLVDVATGDVNGDGVDDLVFEGAQQVVVRDGKTNATLRTIQLGRGFGAGGLDVGDVTGDGRGDIVLADGSVRVYDGRNGALVRTFAPYGATYTGSIAVAVGDLEGDARAEIATAAGTHVKVFSAGGTTLRSFFAYEPSFTGGVDVAAGDATGDGHADLVTVPRAGAPAYVRVFSGSTLIRSFLAGDAGSLGGATVASGDGSVTVASGATIRVVDGATLATKAFFMPFGPSAGHIAIAT
jgi:hypothetical protein